MRTLSLLACLLVTPWIASEAGSRQPVLKVNGYLGAALADANMRSLLQTRLDQFSDALASVPQSVRPGPVPMFEVLPGTRRLHITATEGWPDNEVAMLWDYAPSADPDRFIPATSVDIGRSPLLAGRGNRFNRVRAIVSRARLADEAANEVAGVEAIIEYATLIWLMDHNQNLVPRAVQFLNEHQRGTIDRALRESTGSLSCMNRIRGGVEAIWSKWRDLHRAGDSSPPSEGRPPSPYLPVTC